MSFHNGEMITSNVGDSRAVLGYKIDHNLTRPSNEEEKKEMEPALNTEPTSDSERVRDMHGELVTFGEGAVVALPLSHDQTPYRHDELERVKRAGGRVLTVDMIEGLESVHENFCEFKPSEEIDEKGDPPRIWRKDADLPGTAFSRSMGDVVAEEIGVICEPEIVTRKATNNDKILVLASDGVFEFLPSQKVIDMCSDCSNPVEACEMVVGESYKKWLHYELRTDDITIIVLFIHCDRKLSSGKESTHDLLNMSAAQGQKPMRVQPRDSSNGKTNMMIEGISHIIQE